MDVWFPRHGHIRLVIFMSRFQHEELSFPNQYSSSTELKTTYDKYIPSLKRKKGHPLVAESLRKQHVSCTRTYACISRRFPEITGEDNLTVFFLLRESEVP